MPVYKCVTSYEFNPEFPQRPPTLSAILSEENQNVEVLSTETGPWKVQLSLSP